MAIKSVWQKRNKQKTIWKKNHRAQPKKIWQSDIPNIICDSTCEQTDSNKKTEQIKKSEAHVPITAYALGQL